MVSWVRLRSEARKEEYLAGLQVAGGSQTAHRNQVVSNRFAGYHTAQDFDKVGISAHHADHKWHTLRQRLLGPLRQLGEVVQISGFNLIITRRLLASRPNAERQNRKRSPSNRLCCGEWDCHELSPGLARVDCSSPPQGRSASFRRMCSMGRAKSDSGIVHRDRAQNLPLIFTRKF